jgi:tetraacyldisaccharide 4'-kinase
MSRGRSLPGFVLSIGNLTAGGTGKTPAACLIAGWAREQGYKVAVLSRGYGGKSSDKVRVVSDGSEIVAEPFQVGDEPILIARNLKGVPVVVARKRFLAGQAASRDFGADFFVLDDGFQHRALMRDLDLVLMDSKDPLGNGHLLPWGPLREPVRNISRAQAVVYTRSGNEGAVDERIEKWLSHAESIPCFRGGHAPAEVVLPSKNTTDSPAFLKGKSIVAFCGIARPGAFLDTLVSLGAEIKDFRSYPDHHPFSGIEMEQIKARRRELGAEYIVTTEKDWIRAETRLLNEPCAAYLRVKLEILSGRDAFFKMIRDRAADVGVEGAIGR